MAPRKWDELNNDCLIQIFARVDTYSLARFIPFVCKSWYHATFDPQCWTTLKFPAPCRSVNLIKYAVGRAQRSSTAVVFGPPFRSATREDLICIAEGCPLLKTLVLPMFVESDKYLLLSKLIGNWKHLEFLRLSYPSNFQRTMKSISLHCHNFVSLVLNGTRIRDERVSAIVGYTPNIKYLSMSRSWLSRQCLLKLLKGCTALETLDLSGCIGFQEGDDEIMKLASHIKSFNCSGARL